MYIYNLAKQEYFIISNASLFRKLGSKRLLPSWEIIKSSKFHLFEDSITYWWSAKEVWKRKLRETKIFLCKKGYWPRGLEVPTVGDCSLKGKRAIRYKQEEYSQWNTERYNLSTLPSTWPIQSSEIFILLTDAKKSIVNNKSCWGLLKGMNNRKTQLLK